jgi:hypothetical protein
MKSFKQPSLRLGRRGCCRPVQASSAPPPSGWPCRASCAPKRAGGAADDGDKADIARVEGYLNGISSMKASFQQFTDSEGLAFGRIYLRRPGGSGSNTIRRPRSC